MAGRVDDLTLQAADPHRVAFAHGLVHMRDARRLGTRRDHAAFVLAFDLADALGVIGMMVRHQDVAQPPTGFFERGLDRRRLRHIDRRGGAACRMVDQYAEIVLQAGEQINLRGHVVFPVEPVPAGSSAFTEADATWGQPRLHGGRKTSAIRAILPLWMSSTCAISTPNTSASWPGALSAAAFARAGRIPMGCACSASAMRRPISACSARRPSAASP